MAFNRVVRSSVAQVTAVEQIHSVPPGARVAFVEMANGDRVKVGGLVVGHNSSVAVIRNIPLVGVGKVREIRHSRAGALVEFGYHEGETLTFPTFDKVGPGLAVQLWNGSVEQEVTPLTSYYVQPSKVELVAGGVSKEGVFDVRSYRGVGLFCTGVAFTGATASDGVVELQLCEEIGGTWTSAWNGIQLSNAVGMASWASAFMAGHGYPSVSLGNSKVLPWLSQYVALYVKTPTGATFANLRFSLVGWP